MKRFHLNRSVDETGISGTGIVAEGVVFENGKVAMSWRTAYTSVAVYDSIRDVEVIHGHGGRTKIEWVDDASDVKQSSKSEVCGSCGARVLEWDTSYDGWLRCPHCKSC